MNEGISIVIPCLNEAVTLPLVLNTIESVKKGELTDTAVEVIVSDNGSTDGSVAIGKALGARVLHCTERGYGAALLHGIQHATYDIVAFADADNTYDFGDVPKLMAKLGEGYDLVVGTRMKGAIDHGAMPFMHRYLGTPVLNFFINLLHSSRQYKTSDCNSGFRCFRRSAFVTWGIRSTGMEFASEMLIKAMRSHAKIAEVPIALHPDIRHRTPHLKRWRDGMRHLLEILLEAPQFFHHAGVTLVAVSWLVILMSLFFGPMHIGFAWVFGLHTMIFAQLTSCVGVTVWSIGLFLCARSAPSNRVYAYLITLPEDRLFWYSFALGMCCALLILGIVVYWATRGYQFISAEKEALTIASFTITVVLVTVNTLAAHLLRKS